MNYHIYREYLSLKKGNRKKLPGVFWLLMLFMSGYLGFFVFAGFSRKSWMIIIGLVFLILFFGILFDFDKKMKSKNIEDFSNKKADRKALYKYLKLYGIEGKERIVSLGNWLKIHIENYEKRVKTILVIFSTVTFSGIVAFSGSVLPSVFEKDAVVPEYVINGILWCAGFILVSFLVFFGLYLSEYFDYKNMKTFLDELQDILDYNLYEENEQNENEDNTSQAEYNEDIKENKNVETQNKAKTKKCKKKIGRKITIEIVKYDYTGDSSVEL